MKLRVARHTTDLKPITGFYRDILGLEVIGQFKDHDGYDGVFLGDKNADWHLEFTMSNELPKHTPDEDDFLVFYPVSADEYDSIVKRFAVNNIKEIAPKNPYWKENGVTFSDPDGYWIVIAAI
jgi:catechol 2,3-dioxygenase-like lactoylglutathione lyase family enzyme